LPFRLYAEHAQGISTEGLAERYAYSPTWVAERIEAARLCLERQVRVETIASIG
jgi:hypothetical protein